MNIAFYNGASGLIAFQQDMDVLSHNMANVNTVGYKGSSAAFSDLLYTEMDTNPEPKPLTGHGTKVFATQLNCSQGAPVQTNRPLDLAIIGDGFFAIERSNGEIQYTRNGNFNISVEGRDGYLVAADGGYVLDAAGKRITLDSKDESGTFDQTNLAQKVGIYQFKNPYGLEKRDMSSFVPTDISGEPIVAKEGQNTDYSYDVVQSALESSNVNLSDEMVHLIVTQRAYQMNAKIVQTADEIEQIVNSLR